MNLFGLDVPIWVLDWTGSVLVAWSLMLLFEKRLGYWHVSNASLVPYFLLFVTTEQYMLAGLQVSYLIFGIHGLCLWGLQRRRARDGSEFDEQFWFRLGWVLTGGIFVYSVALTDFVDAWVWLQFTIVSLSLIANLATTRKVIWSWYLWMVVNTLQAVYFAHYELWGQLVLQFALFGMSIVGARRWVAQRDRSNIEDVNAGLVV